MKIQVTQEHIDRGKRASCVSCPLALAVRDCVRPEALLKAAHWITGGITVGFSSVHVGLTVIELPPSAREFIRRFDTPYLQHMAVPFEFELPDLEGLWRQ